MQFIVNVGILVLLWIATLFNGTGLDSVYHITAWAQRITVLLFAIDVGYKAISNRQMLIKRNDFYTFGGMTTIFIGSTWIHGFGASAGIDYLWVFCLIYLLSKLEIDDKTMLCTGLAYGVMGFAILYIFDYGNTLKGWNTNSIAMIGMHSFLILLVPFFQLRQWKSKLFLLAATIGFSVLVSQTNSRSGILFGVIAALFAINVIPRGLITKDRRVTLLWLLAPLIIALIVIQVSKGGYMDSLNQWSYEHFRKPIFNGRDELWEWGLDELWTSPLFGIGNFNAANWHNSAITCLVATGILGFIFWIASFANILNMARPYLRDYIVTGCFIDFVVLYAQQSVELGFISGNPTLLGYILLGIMLGRVNYLRKGE